MSDKWLVRIALLLGLLTTASANAITLSFNPSQQTVLLGDLATVDVVVSDLDSQRIGAFDFNVSWDPTIIGFDNISFGNLLDGPALSFQSVALADGSLNAAEVSFGSLSGQAGVTSFTLFTLTFDTRDVGLSALTFSGGISPAFDYLGDGSGVALPTTALDGQIAVVPLPAGFVLLLSGLCVFGRLRRG